MRVQENDLQDISLCARLYSIRKRRKSHTLPAPAFRINMGKGRAQLSKFKVEKFPLTAFGKAVQPPVILAADKYLITDIVNTGHMLPFHCPEKMAHAAAKTAVLV